VAVKILEVSLPCVRDVFDPDVVALASSTEDALADNDIANTRDNVTGSIAQCGVGGAAHNAAERLNTNAHIRTVAGNVPERLIPKTSLEYVPLALRSACEPAAVVSTPAIQR